MISRLKRGLDFALIWINSCLRHRLKITGSLLYGVSLRLASLIDKEVRSFLSKARGRVNGSYPYNYVEIIDAVFRKEDDTIEVCSGSDKTCYAVDINPEVNPNLVDDGQLLSSVPNNRFSLWRGDPPFNSVTARKMYGTDLPSPIKLLQAGARVCKVGSLMFLHSDLRITNGIQKESRELAPGPRFFRLDSI